jgi:hypothetical protein
MPFSGSQDSLRLTLKYGVNGMLCYSIAAKLY